MKSTAPRINPSFAISSRMRHLVLLAGSVLCFAQSAAEARGLALAAGRGYRAGVYRGFGYGAFPYGYYGDTTSIQSSGSSSAPSSSLPSGALRTLPSGAAPVVVFGKTYYFANGNYYSPKMYGGSTIYVVANP